MKYLYGAFAVGLYLFWLVVLALIDNVLIKSFWSLLFIPVCIVGYLSGKKDVRREIKLKQGEKL